MQSKWEYGKQGTYFVNTNHFVKVNKYYSQKVFKKFTKKTSNIHKSQ